MGSTYFRPFDLPHAVRKMRKGQPLNIKTSDTMQFIKEWAAFTAGEGAQPPLPAGRRYRDLPLGICIPMIKLVNNDFRVRREHASYEFSNALGDTFRQGSVRTYNQVGAALRSLGVHRAHLSPLTSTAVMRLAESHHMEVSITGSCVAGEVKRVIFEGESFEALRSYVCNGPMDEYIPGMPTLIAAELYYSVSGRLPRAGRPEWDEEFDVSPYMRS